MGDAVAVDTADGTGGAGELRASFDRVPLLAAVTAEARGGLWAQVRVGRGSAGRVLVTQGAATDILHVLLAGEATSLAVTPEGRTVGLARWLAPVVIDKVTMFTEGRHPATVTADTPVVWCSLPFPAVRAAVAASPRAQGHALAVLAGAAQEARDAFVDVATRSAPARLARWLVVTDGAGVPLVIPRPQERLAFQLGMTRVTLNRALHHLADRGLISIEGSAEGSAVTVVDRPGLDRLAH